MLVANKIDNIHNRVVTESEGEELARRNGMMFIETSAKEKIGVNEAFEEVVNKVLESPMIDEVSLRRRGPVGTEGQHTRLNYVLKPDENGDS